MNVDFESLSQQQRTEKSVQNSVISKNLKLGIAQ